MSADVEGAMQDAIQSAFPTARAVTELPGDLAAAGVVHRVTRVGGGRYLTLDACRLSVETFTPKPRSNTRAAAEKLADWAAYQLPGTTVGNARFTKVTVDSGPTVINYPNPDVRCCTTTFTVHVLTV